MTSLRSCLAVLAFAVCAGVLAQSPLPQTLYVPVIIYDYKADGTNPNFEPTPWDETRAGLRPQMVQPTLSAQRKPQLLFDRCWNDSVAIWFRPNGGNPGTFGYNGATGRWEWSSLVNYQARADEFVATGFNASHPLANIVFYENLAFTLQSAATGTYQFENNEFFPINNRGWGNQPATYPAYGWTNPGRNYSFSMELHHQFTFRRGLQFDFTGDDDVWAFIDGRLRMDLGGIHGALSGSINLDTLGLVEGQSYYFDFFYCERHVSQSSIRITTNLVAPITVDSLHVTAQPLVARIPAGDSVKYTVTVYLDSAGVKLQKPGYDALVQWSVSGSAQNPGMTVDQGKTSTFLGQRAYVTYTITATLRDPATGTLYTKTMTVTVDPGPPDKVVIEPDNTPDNWTPEPVERVVLGVGVQHDSVYAVLRDRFNNLVRLGDAISWRSLNTGVSTVAATPGKPYEGDVARGPFSTASSDSTWFIASQAGVRLADTALVVIQNRLQVSPPIARPGDTAFIGSLSVTLTTATEGATIYYCINCSTNPQPGAPGVQVYSGPIEITAIDTTRIRAIAVKQGYENSTVSSWMYINERDMRGPEITRVQFYLGNPPGSRDQTRSDTLIITFNEPVLASDLNNLVGSFVYSDGGVRGKEGDVFSGASIVPPTDQYVTRVVVILPGGTGQVTPEEDSVQIKPGSLEDRWTNQAPANGPIVVIEWGRDYDIVVTISANPFQPGRTRIPQDVLNRLDPVVVSTNGQPPQSSIVLRVSSLREINYRESKMIVYDAVGNVISESALAYPESGGGVDNTTYFFWDASNRNNRLVGSGTYLAMLQVKESVTGNTLASKYKICIER